MNFFPGMHIHLIGIGGAGLSAIARLLLERGCQVSGSDRQDSALAQDLRRAGAQVFIGHAAAQVHGAQLVIRSSAIPESNPEMQEALRLGLPVLKRADFLGQLIAESTSIAVAGTSGKTTTTAMLAWIFTALGKDPSFIIGGVSQNLGTNAHAGKGRHFIIEADEYDRMFLGLRPTFAVVTNVEHDHPDCYPTAEDFYQAFASFARLLPSDGALIVCADDPGANRLAAEAQAFTQVYTYGTNSPAARYRATGLYANQRGGFTFDAHLENQPMPVELQAPGIHNVNNALAALAVAHICGLDLVQVGRLLEEFSGVGRRFEVRGQVQNITVIDDYGHHPTKIRATLAAARARYPGRRIWAVWQPHTYSRTQQFFADFTQAFDDADRVVVTEVYASREAPPPDGFSSRQVVTAMHHPAAYFIPALNQATEFLLERLQPGDILIVLSAGDADQISLQVLDALQRKALDQPNLEERNQSHV